MYLCVCEGEYESQCLHAGECVCLCMRERVCVFDGTLLQKSPIKETIFCKRGGGCIEPPALRECVCLCMKERVCV